MDAERTETKISRDLLYAARKRAAEEGRDESEIIEEALRRYLASLDDPARTTIGSERAGRIRGESFDEVFARVRESQRRRGVTPLSDEEAMKLAVEEQHAHRRGE